MGGSNKQTSTQKVSEISAVIKIKTGWCYRRVSLGLLEIIDDYNTMFTTSENVRQHNSYWYSTDYHIYFPMYLKFYFASNSGFPSHLYILNENIDIK